MKIGANLDKTDKLKVIGDCDGKMAYVSASNRSTPDYQLHSIMFTGMMNKQVGRTMENHRISQEEAVKLTNQKLKELIRLYEEDDRMSYCME